MANLYDIDSRLVTLLDEHFDTEDGTIYESEEDSFNEHINWAKYNNFVTFVTIKRKI